jgi:glycosyltransferase involved in cell wall biosynthesis
MRFGIVYKDEGRINAHYRALMPAKNLISRGHELVWYGTSSQSLPLRELSGCDLVHVYRASEPELIAALKRLRGEGVALSWDNDDDLTILPKDSPSYRKHGGLTATRDFTWQVRAIRLAHLVTTTSSALAEKFRRVGGEHVAIIDNYLPRDFLYGRRQKHKGLIIGWAGGVEQRVDAASLGLDEVLLKILLEHPGVRLLTVGVSLNVRHERYEHERSVEFLRLPRVIRGFDIGLAPLADIPFNRTRSAIKLKEYGAAGVPWLASPVGEYADLGPRQGGRLVADCDWYDAIDDLLRHRRQRMLLGTRARFWAHQQAMRHYVDRWEREFEAAIQRARGDAAHAAA